MVPFERNEGFIGRQEIIHQLLDRVPPSANKDACQRTVIEGLGGVGKTQIALEAAFRLRHEYPLCSVFWVPSVDATSFENAYRDIGRLLGVAGIDEDKADVKAIVKAALSHKDAGQWLLIIDNADDSKLLFGPTGLSSFLPCSMNGSILFTTRTREVTVRLDVHPAGIIKTTKMSREEATEMLQARLTETQMQDTASLTGLLDFLDDLPLAIRQASAYMHKTGMTTARYLEQCRSSDSTLVNLLSRDFEDRGRYDTIKNPVATAWLISFRHIARDRPQAGGYLRFMSFLSERDIPIAMLPATDDELEVDEAIGTLEAYGFITKREEGASIDMHRLVRLAMRNWLDQEGQARKTYCGVIGRMEEVFPFPEHENRAIWMKYLPHARIVLESDEKCDDGEAISSLLFNVAGGFSMLGSYQQAEMMYRQALELRKKVVWKEDAFTRASMNNLARVLDSMGQYEEAEKMDRQTLELREKVLGKEHPVTFGSMNNLALVLDSMGHMGQYEEAEKMHRQTLELKEKVLGKEHPDTLGSMSNLAGTLHSQGKYEAAVKMHRQTVELMEKVLGKEHPDTLGSMNNLASVLDSMGQYEEAEKMHRQTLELKEKALGKEHPDTLASMNNLANVLDSTGKYEEAEKMHRQTVELMEKVLGKVHPDTLGSMNNLAGTLHSQGKYEAAVKMHRQTLELKEKVLGKEHRDTLASMNNLARVLDSMGQYEEAEKMHRQTLELKEKALGKEHPDTLGSMNNLASVLDSTGQYEEAEKMHRQTVELKEKVLGKEHPDTLGSMNNLAGTLHSQGKYEAAV
ncbi:hypothetical protein NW755_014637, partial [Fusarium falciforme]